MEPLRVLARVEARVVVEDQPAQAPQAAELRWHSARQAIPAQIQHLGAGIYRPLEDTTPSGSTFGNSKLGIRLLCAKFAKEQVRNTS